MNLKCCLSVESSSKTRETNDENGQKGNAWRVPSCRAASRQASRTSSSPSSSRETGWLTHISLRVSFFLSAPQEDFLSDLQKKFGHSRPPAGSCQVQEEGKSRKVKITMTIFVSVFLKTNFRIDFFFGVIFKGICFITMGVGGR